ncbi:prolipoprotein diacylglyceryl transferase [Phenylobacterium sp.]|uniref:prolipoprotein diacylglyceryl transferase n=1 Tax=Phenylobacterium sp. TaxID=1871053 RepID=UPI00286C267E|nr:prolipoprotein diacylglyceryl transferase [Phenylobacterium sp.]
MPFPDFNPILFQIGPFAIRWYALAYVAGILLGWRYVAYLMKRQELWAPRAAPATGPQVDDLVVWLTLGIIVGGRLGHVFFYTPSLIWEDPLQIPQTWNGGMSFHGGAIGVLVAVIGFSRLNKIDMLRLWDAVCAATPFGLFFGRVANFINGELWGRPTDVPWAVVFPNGGILARHPSQLYEAALEGVALFLILLWATHGAKLLRRRGVVAGIFMLAYAVFRMALENVREPDAYLPEFPLGLTMGMMLSLPMAVLGAWLIWRGMREPIPDSVPEQAPATPAAGEPARSR